VVVVLLCCMKNKLIKAVIFFMIDTSIGEAIAMSKHVFMMKYNDEADFLEINDGRDLTNWGKKIRGHCL